ncbi:AP-3 complex subunit delta [Trichomonascus vanleenenianus]|uniref:Apl5p n=1 Tax=Trichomonascus vanleenenianus TaxID=2268995 RepID=UPI003ECB0FED
MQAAREDTRARLRPFGIVFEKSLHDLIRGIRSAKDPQAREAFLKDALADCRAEVRNPDMETKTMAVLKLAYLEMYGYDMSWASFHVLEIMSSPKFQQKRVGYLAAIQSFRSDTDVLMLTTNLLKKDLGSAHSLEVSVALSGVATIVTPSLAQDVSDDIVKMLNHSKPYIRKKAVLAMYKVFLQFPEALRVAFPRLKEKLEDADQSVVSATVNVISELARQTTNSSKTFLALAPQLYELLTTSQNNWMLIKILKLFSSLAPSEPRLKAKLLPQILQLMETTTAMSLLYECINCIVSGGMLDETDYKLAALMVSKLRVFLEQTDQNLKYVGLLAFTKVVKVHPQFVSESEELILDCLDDADLTIRERALELVSHVVSEENIYSIVSRLMDQLRSKEFAVASSPDYVKDKMLNLGKSYRQEAVKKIIQLCSKNTYEYIPDFEWYVSILAELVQLSEGLDESVGHDIGFQLRNVAIRVKSMREEVVNASSELISCRVPLTSVLSYTVWVIGEYANGLRDPLQTLDNLVHLETEDGTTLNALIPAVIKVYASWAGNRMTSWDSYRVATVKRLSQQVIKFLEKYSTHDDYEVQERAVEFLELIKLTLQSVEEHPADENEPPMLLSYVLPSLFNEFELNPVAPTAQQRIAVPDDLDLDTELFPRCDLYNSQLDVYNDVEDSEDDELYSVISDITTAGSVTDKSAAAEEDADRRKQERIERQRFDPFYIPIPSGYGTPGSSTTPRSGTPTLANEPAPEQQPETPSASATLIPKQRKPRKKKVEIMQDEMIEGDKEEMAISTRKPKKSGLLQINSRIAELNLEEDESSSQGASDIEQLRREYLEQYTKPAEESTEVAVTHKSIKKKKKKKTTEGEDTGEKKKKKKKKAKEAKIDEPSSATTPPTTTD